MTQQSWGDLKFLLTPLREGRRSSTVPLVFTFSNFYSRPCGRGDNGGHVGVCHALCISTHAPAGGAT